MAKNFNTTFCERAYKLFEEWSIKTHGKMSQPKVSEFTGIPQPIISKIKTEYYSPKDNPYQPSAETVYKVAKAFNVSTDYLLGLVDVQASGKDYSEGFRKGFRAAKKDIQYTVKEMQRMMAGILGEVDD